MSRRRGETRCGWCFGWKTSNSKWEMNENEIKNDDRRNEIKLIFSSRFSDSPLIRLHSTSIEPRLLLAVEGLVKSAVCTHSTRAVFSTFNSMSWLTTRRDLHFGVAEKKLSCGEQQKKSYWVMWRWRTKGDWNESRVTGSELLYEQSSQTAMEVF